MSAADLKTLRTLHAAATPSGEWQAVEGDLEGKPVSEYARTLFANRENDGTTTERLFLTVAPNPIDPERRATVVPALTGNGPQSEANALLISAAVNALPDLLAIAETHHQLVAKVEAVEAILAAWDAWDGSPGPDGRMHPDSSSPADRDRLRAALNVGEVGQ